MTATTIRNRKRKADVLGRLDTSDSSGRGTISGWTACPLCGQYSTKKYALGRGISSHLHAVHTPWKGSKMELKIKRREFERIAAEARKKGSELTPSPATMTNMSSWEPSEQEERDWEHRVLEITTELEARPNEILGRGFDRTGKNKVKKYRESLPEIIQAAADGTLTILQALVEAVGDDVDKRRMLLETRDRNGSTAEHWAAGEGHLDCLQYLVKTRRILPELSTDQTNNMRGIRRRQGKTCMHYAARNGRLHVIQFLIDANKDDVDKPSGDGTTPLHLALYGGHLAAAQLLIQNGADPHATNEWECGSAHWIAMTKSSSNDASELCDLLLKAGVPFDVAQKHGHFPLHKACQRTNKRVIEWLTKTKFEGGAGLSDEQLKKMGKPDNGGHTPSEIWRSAGGEEHVAKWMKENHGW